MCVCVCEFVFHVGVTFRHWWGSTLGPNKRGTWMGGDMKRDRGVSQ